MNWLYSIETLINQRRLISRLQLTTKEIILPYILCIFHSSDLLINLLLTLPAGSVEKVLVNGWFQRKQIA